MLRFSQPCAGLLSPLPSPVRTQYTLCTPWSDSVGGRVAQKGASVLPTLDTVVLGPTGSCSLLILKFVLDRRNVSKAACERRALMIRVCFPSPAPARALPRNPVLTGFNTESPTLRLCIDVLVGLLNSASVTNAWASPLSMARSEVAQLGQLVEGACLSALKWPQSWARDFRRTPAAHFTT